MNKLLILLSFMFSGCDGDNLGNKISKGLIERKAIENGVHCYTNSSNHRFCVKHMGLDQEAQNRAEAKRTSLEELEFWWLSLEFK